MKVVKIVTAAVIVGLILAASWWWFGSRTSAPSEQVKKSVSTVQDERLSKGNSDAPVTMVEYVDMMCPDCARMHQEVMPKIQENYIDTGKLSYEVRVVSKIYHKDAQVAAGGAYCAAEQGKFWPYLDLTYEKLRNLGEHAESIEELTIFAGNNARTFAEEVGVNVPAWEYCVKHEAYGDVIDQNEKTMSSLNAYGTPHSVINGENYNGAPPYSTFKTVIDAALKKEEKR